MDKYDHKTVESKWQKVWEENKLNVTDIKGAKKPFYNLWMFPYPSAEGLHVGHAFASTASDIYGRFKRFQGYDVFQPIGYDSFGIHSENFALKIGEHPKKFTDRATKNYERQLRAMGHIYDWTKTVTTSDPSYYKWTQWIFLQMFKKGLAYRGKGLVNFCPKCKTVLSDEQVINDKCERCGTVVEKKEMEQWFFKITAYADRLLKNLDDLDWTTKIKLTQKNWIGKSEGVHVEFEIENSDQKIKVFTTAHDTIYGVTFMVISPEYAKKVINLVSEINRSEVEKYIKSSLEKSETERTNDTKIKTGVPTGINVINPFSESKVPIFVADYVLSSYGTGGVMGVPGHDARDHEVATKYNLPIIPGVKPIDPTIKTESDGFWNYADIKHNLAEKGILFNSGILDGLNSKEARKKIETEIEKRKIGEKVVNYHLRDWLISRQRYWGPPIPMINCPKCGWIPVLEKDLPVLLPDISDYQPEGNGKGPLANHPDFYQTKCPQCRGDAERETDVSDTFLDSSWYELRYPSIGSSNVPFDRDITKKWLPVDMYMGGAEHAVLHLMYFRFVTMVLKDLGHIDFEEPTKSFFAHGLIIKDGAKMSKSRGNVVNPDEYIARYGADALRLYFMFMGPVWEGGDFRDAGMEGMRRWVERVYRTVSEIKLAENPDKKVENDLAKLIKKAESDFESRHYNTIIAKMMEFVNLVTAENLSLTADQIKKFLVVLAPIAPHLAEELYQRATDYSLQTTEKSSVVSSQKSVDSIHRQSWPVVGEIAEESSVIAVMVNGKLRSTTSPGDQKTVESAAKSDPKVTKYLDGQTVKKVVFVPGKVINFVV